MFGGVFVRGVIAAAYVTADQADAQMYPAAAHFQALFTAFCAGHDVLNLIQMGAVRRYDLTGFRQMVASFAAPRKGHFVTRSPFNKKFLLSWIYR